MIAITIAIVTGIMIAITLALLLLNLHYNNQFHQCDADLLLWCYTDWNCQYGTNDPYGNLVGYGDAIPMECYLKGMYGKLTADDKDCGSWAADYNRPKDKCYPTSETDNPTCDQPTTPEIYPCSCNGITNNNYGSNYFTKTGFVIQGNANSPAGAITGGVIACADDSGNTTPDPANGCWSMSEIFCNQVGKQFNACNSSPT